MTVNNLIFKITKFFSTLYFRHWERWELLIIVLISLVLLLFIIWQQRKVTTKRIYVNQFRERSPIIGVKLADNRSHLKIEDVKKDGLASSPKKQAKQRKTKEQLDKLNEQVQQLQYEISKHKQVETRFEHQVKELTAANEKLRQNTVISTPIEQSKKQQPAEVSIPIDKLQQKIAGSKQAEQKPKRQIIEVPAVTEKTQQESAESSSIGQQTQQQIGELKATLKPPKSSFITRKRSERMFREKTEHGRIPKELREQPLDVEKLKAIAELAKQIQERRPLA
jgi:cell division septum initiation protein DivIVA